MDLLTDVNCNKWVEEEFSYFNTLFLCKGHSLHSAWWSSVNHCIKTLPRLFIVRVTSPARWCLGSVAGADCWLIGQFIRRDRAISPCLLWDVSTCWWQKKLPPPGFIYFLMKFLSPSWSIRGCCGMHLITDNKNVTEDLGMDSPVFSY